MLVFKIASIVYYSLCFVAAVLHGRSKHAKAVASVVDTMYNVVFAFAHVRVWGVLKKSCVSAVCRIEFLDIVCARSRYGVSKTSGRPHPRVAQSNHGKYLDCFVISTRSLREGGVHSTNRYTCEG